MRTPKRPGPTEELSVRRTPLRHHAMLIASLLTLTLGAGVAARIAGPATDPARGSGNATSVSAATAHGGGVRISAAPDRHSVLRGGDGHVRVELVIGADVPQGFAPDAPRTPTDLVVVLDRSGSMEGAPLHFAKAAVRELISQLSSEDRFGLVTYATGGQVAIPLERTHGNARARWDRTLDALHANGGTNMSRGLDLAHGLLAGERPPGRALRVILLSDGHANQGDHDLASLRARAARAVAAEYVLSAVGVGQGFDEVVMSQVADAGTGNFYYLPDLRELAGVFADEFIAARDRVAHALEVYFRPGDGVRIRDVGGLPLERDGDGVRFRPGDLFAGQERRLFVTLQAPTATLGELALGDVALRFTDAEGERRDLRLIGLPKLACVAGEEDYFATFDEDVYKRASRGEGIGSLKQKVAALLQSGRRDEAVEEVDRYLSSMETEQMRALGYVVAEDAAETRALRDAVAAPEAASPAVQNRLGKAFLEAGRDARRAGSKRD